MVLAFRQLVLNSKHPFQMVRERERERGREGGRGGYMYVCASGILDTLNTLNG